MSHPEGPLAELGRMAEAGQAGVVLSTPDGISDANGAFLRMTGFTRPQLNEGQAHWRAITAPEWTSRDGDHLSTRTTRNFPADISRGYARIPLDEAARTPIGWTVRSGQPLMLTSGAS